ncbi:MAG: Tpl protein [Candidatus Cloacimonadota bacterium]|nr:MAG: Tpl protein [Candidatus Cloacimonadota bacterium]
MKEFVEIEFRSGRTGYVLNPDNFDLTPGQKVIIEIERGIEIVEVVYNYVNSETLEKALDSQKVFNILRVADEQDLSKLASVQEEEKKAKDVFLDILKKYPLEMKLVETLYQLDGSKLTFFFRAEERVDFREFVRELASIFLTRIELHQTNGRYEAKRMGGFGMCGYQYCCSAYLKSFHPITIKMAKHQNLNRNLDKIFGPCGRLLCCLQYEEDLYIERNKNFPETGETVFYKNMKNYVYKNDIYNQKVHLMNNSQEITVLSLDEFLSCTGNNCPRKAKNNGKSCCEES